MRRSNAIEFAERSRKVHGDKYDYSLVEYINNYTKVKILCKKHNHIFLQRPLDHLQGNGCLLCWNERLASGTHGVGVCDIYGATKTVAYHAWSNILLRCYDEKALEKHPTYKRSVYVMSGLYSLTSKGGLTRIMLKGV